MSLEDALKTNTASLDRNSDLLEKLLASGFSAGGKTTTGTTTGGKGGAGTTTGGKKPKFTAEQVKASAKQVLSDIGEDDAKALIVKYAGKGKKLADLINLPEKWDAFCNEAKTLIEAAADTGDDDDSGDDDEL